MRPVAGSADAGAQQRVDHQRGGARFRRNLALHLAAARPAASRRFAAASPFSSSGSASSTTCSDAGANRVCNWRAITRPSPPLLPLPQSTTMRCSAERREAFGQKLHYAVPGILHQDDARDAGLDGAPVHFAHFRRGQDLHKRRATTMVISSCNSPAPVQCTTASMVRAMSSAESARAYFTSRSFRRSSPNISP